MKFKRLLLGVSLLAGFSAFAQTGTAPVNKPLTYKFRLYNAESDLSKAKELLSHFTGASAITYNVTDSVFTVTTSRELSGNIVAGKMQKNFYPVKTMEKVDHSFPKFIDTGDAQHDARDYEARKTKWIAENPEEYKVMANPSKK